MGSAPTVLHVVDCLRIGGTERQLLCLLRHMERDRYVPYVACFQRTGELVSELEELGISPREFPLKGSLLQPNTAVQLLRLARFSKEIGARVLHAHDFYSNVIAVALGRALGLPVVVSRRDLAHWLGRGHRGALKIASRLADRVLCNALAVGELASADAGVSSKIAVIPNGIDLPSFDLQANRTPQPALPSPSGGFTAAMIGSMNLPDKGHEDLLDAAERLAARGRRIDWWLLSDGALRPRLEACRDSRGLTDSVHFLGKRDDVPAILARVDLVVHPSWAEGFPNAILEAMAARRPVVATRVGGAAELIIDGANGLLVEPRKPGELADAVERMLSDPARAAAMGRLGRLRIESRFTADRMCHATAALYDSLLP